MIKEKKGLVERAVDKNDRRVNNIVVTEKGMAMKQSTKELAIDSMNKVVDGIPEEQLTIFVDVLRKACNNIEKMGAKSE